MCILNTCKHFKGGTRHLLSKNIQELTDRNVNHELRPSIHLSSLLKSSYFKLGMREHREEAGALAPHKVPPFSHPLFPQCASYFHQMLRHCLCDFLILVPRLSLSFVSVREGDRSVCGFLWLCMCLSPYVPFISLFCSPSRFRHTPKPVLSLGTLQWVGLPLHLSPQREQRAATVLLSPSLPFSAATAAVPKEKDPREVIYCMRNSSGSRWTRELSDKSRMNLYQPATKPQSLTQT